MEEKIKLLEQEEQKLELYGKRNRELTITNEKLAEDKADLVMLAHELRSKINEKESLHAIITKENSHLSQSIKVITYLLIRFTNQNRNVPII